MMSVKYKRMRAIALRMERKKLEADIIGNNSKKCYCKANKRHKVVVTGGSMSQCCSDEKTFYGFMLISIMQQKKKIVDP